MDELRPRSSEPAPPGKRNWLQATCCFALAFACLWFARPNAPAPTPEATPAVAATDNASADQSPSTKLIRDVRLGEKTVGSNPDRSEVDESLPDPEPETWREVRLSMLKENGDQLRIELLRPLDWIANAASVGSTVHLDLEEMGAAGPATVTYVGPCPPIQEGSGNAVTGRFIHSSSGNLLNLHIEGDSDPVGVTDNHPYWSVDRQAFVDAGELGRGEQVDTLAGIRTVASIVPRPVDEAVYNLEIHREHVYRVGASGTLVHNSYAAIARSVTKRFGNLQCEECANALVKRFSAAGIHGQRIELRGTGRFIVSASHGDHEAISNNGRHIGVRVGDMVYDNIHKSGTPFSSWLKDFDSPGGIKISNILEF